MLGALGLISTVCQGRGAGPETDALGRIGQTINRAGENRNKCPRKTNKTAPSQSSHWLGPMGCRVASI